MGARQREWARKKTEQLRESLGNRCAKCGNVHELEFDCIVAQGHTHHRIEWSWRLSFYVQQLRNGNLQLLCEKCHNKKSAQEAPR